MTVSKALPRSSSFRLIDVFGTAAAGLTNRKLRTALSALGITIGIGAMVAVLGLSRSGSAALEDRIAALGTNLLQVSAGQGFGGGDATLPESAVGSIARIGPVTSVSAVTAVDQAVLINDLVNPAQTGGLSVKTADLNLLGALNGTVIEGRFIDESTGAAPTVVLGSVAADRLGVRWIDGTQVLIGGEWFTVIGILASFDDQTDEVETALFNDLDRAAFIGVEIAETLFDTQRNPETIYVRTEEEFIDDVLGVIPNSADPESPEEVEVVRPTDALEAQEAASSTFDNLFLGLGAVALLVGGIGIANVMVIAVIERRNEIGLRRALGATRAHIRRQFLLEALLLSALGGVAGVLLGAAVTAAWANSQGWRIVIPPEAIVGGLIAAIAIGAIAGLYPAVRAARLAPTEALRSS
ncbi:MAG: putative ABC transport system permease protein [Verrucomicrobiales bacterium]|jgi:putative ABC transport system permease protein